MSVTVGETFAGYTIVRLLGSGGMGEVYLPNTQVAASRRAQSLARRRVDGHRIPERFNREAELAATLFHPNIVGVHDRGEFDGQLWIAMDYVEGTDAGQLMGALSRRAVGTRCVRHRHSGGRGARLRNQRGLLHRDVKPANILLTEPEDGERRVLLATSG